MHAHACSPRRTHMYIDLQWPNIAAIDLYNRSCRLHWQPMYVNGGGPRLAGA